MFKYKDPLTFLKVIGDRPREVRGREYVLGYVMGITNPVE